MTAPEQFTDPLGLPYYKRWGLEFDHADAVDLGEFKPPAVLDSIRHANPKAQKMEAQIAQAHFDSPLSHHAQQLTALKWLRDNRGFDRVVKARVHFSTGPADLYLQAGYEFWEQVETAPSVLLD